MKAGWKTVKLGDVCLVYQPETLSQKQLKDGPYPVYGANGQIGFHNEFNHAEPQLTLGCRGTCGAVNWTTENAWINGNAMVVKADEERVTPQFLTYALKGGINIGDSISGTAQPQITRKSLTPIEIPLPPLAEQKRIVALLDEAFAGIDEAKAKAEACLAGSKSLIDCHLRAVFCDQTNGWEKSTIGAEMRFIDYRGKTPAKTASGIRLITAKNVKMGHLQDTPMEFIAAKDYDKWMTRGIPRKGDVLFTTEAPLANVAQLDTDEKVAFAQRVIILQPNANRLNSSFLKYLLISQPVQERIRAKGTGATVQGIKASLLKLIEISFPQKLTTQEEVVAKMDTLLAQAQNLTKVHVQRIEALNELKKSILTQAFAGELTA